MNFVKRSLEGRGTRGGMGASGGVGASSLPASDFLDTLASSSCSPEMLAEELTQRLRRVMQDPEVIAKGEGLNVIFPNGLADFGVFRIVK